MSADSAFMPYRELMQHMSPNQAASVASPVASRASPLAKISSPSMSPIRSSNISVGHMHIGAGTPGDTENDSLADMTVGATGGNMASEQRFKRLSKQLQRSYQEKHLLLTEIQVMKDQLRQWHKEKGKDKLQSAGGRNIAAIPGDEEAAWATLLDLNERANAVALYFMYKGYAFKAMATAFRRWFKHINSAGRAGNVMLNRMANNVGNEDEQVSTFEKRRLELLEMASAVTAATSGWASKSFSGAERNKVDNDSNSMKVPKRISQSASPIGRNRQDRESINSHRNIPDTSSNFDDEMINEDTHRHLFPEEEHGSVSGSDADYYYYDATGRHSSRERKSNRFGVASGHKINPNSAKDTRDRVPRLNFSKQVPAKGRDGPAKRGISSSLTAPTLTSHLRKIPTHGDHGQRGRAARQTPKQHARTPVGSTESVRCDRSVQQDQPHRTSIASRQQGRSRSPSITSARGSVVHMTNAALARAVFIQNKSTDQPNATARPAYQARRRGPSVDREPSERPSEPRRYSDRQEEDYESVNRSATSRAPRDRKSFSDGMQYLGESSSRNDRPMRASFPLRNKSESPQGRNRSQNISANKSFLNNSGLSIPPLPALQREAHHVVLPASPPDSERSFVEVEDASHSFNPPDDIRRADNQRCPPPLPFTSDGLRLQKQREQQIEDKSIAEIIASFGMTGTLNTSLPSYPASSLSAGHSLTGSTKPGNTVTRKGAPHSATQRWGIDMKPLDPSKPALSNLRSLAGLPDLPASIGGSQAQTAANPSTPGGAKRRAEIAMSIIHSMAAVGDTIVEGTRQGVGASGRSSSGYSARNGGHKSTFRN